VKKRIKVKRVYDLPTKEDGSRILVDRIWPRGLKKEDLKLDDWIKEVAPSTELRKWFAHQPEKWEEFKKKYFVELKKKRNLCEELLTKRENNITLLYSAKDKRHNQAIALREFLGKEIL
jgi:uncharacterized protein YeaO (DUF488 family)